MLVERFAENPLITPDDVRPSRDDYEVIGAFNAAAVEYNGETLLLMRIAQRPLDKPVDVQIAPILNPDTGEIELFRKNNNDPDIEIPDTRGFYYKGKLYLTSISHLQLARSKDSINFTIDPNPAVFPKTPYETFGIEDPRITPLEDRFVITYKAVSENGICTALMETKDFKSFDRKGIIFCPMNVDVVIFPEKINGSYYALTRPVPMYLGPAAIWIASSPDLINWGNHKPLLPPRPDYFDSDKTGACCVPIKTEEGWLEIYHASDEKNHYHIAAALLDLDDPSKVIARVKIPLMKPRAAYETKGFFSNVIFACGHTRKNDEITIYYGASDESTAAAKTTIKNILSTLQKS